MLDPFVNPAHVQGSDAWLDERRKHIGASEAATVLGINPWSTPYKLWLDKMGLAEPVEVNDAMRRGTEMEPLARDAFEKMTGLEVFPHCIYHPEHPFMMSSLDGITLDAKTERFAVEIKCGSKAFRLATLGEIPDYYMAQCQHQLACLGIKMLYYFAYDGEKGIIIEVQRDDEYIEDLIKKERKFWEYVETKTPPPLSEKDYVDKDSSPLWITSGARMMEINAQIKSLELEKNSIKELLVEDSNGNSCVGGGIRLARSFPKGVVKYSSIPELNGVDLDLYRSAPKERWTLTQIK